MWNYVCLKFPVEAIVRRDTGVSLPLVLMKHWRMTMEYRPIDVRILLFQLTFPFILYPFSPTSFRSYVSPAL
jgi:hypothetical protein